jgi:predicted metal-dependent HD superfamily phosphohydrolase
MSQGSYTQVSLERWRALGEAARISGSETEFTRITRAWRGFGRRYHTLAHLAACLAEFDLARHLAQRPVEVEVALWFHDAIYRTWRKDNELRSADWAARFLRECGAAAAVAERVHGLVMATAHLAGELNGDAALVVDIDLSILGQPAEIYDEFERNVRREYWWVPKARFAAACGVILRSFLARPAIYSVTSIRDRYEAAARINLERALKALTSD